MHQRIAHIAIVVDDYDKAIEWYSSILGFNLTEDTKLSDTKRWVIMTPPGARECSLLLARASDDSQAQAIGNQTGGRVFLFLHTDDFDRDYHRYLERGVEFVRPKQQFEYGTVAVFKDLYGNLWDLIQPTAINKGML